MLSMFSGRKLVIATMHGKEKVIAPVLEQTLGVTCIIPDSFNTDLLGTFTGEKEREEDPLATARKKCLLAMEATGCDMGIANEGSFGPHPSLYFIGADDELVIFIDQKNNLEIIAREISTETNFSYKEIAHEKELMEFADQVMFPSHGLILRKSRQEQTDIVKGITDMPTLLDTYQTMAAKYPMVGVETDMRAMYNPTRMKVIEIATKKLIEKIQTACPACQMPGFSITDAKTGLPCDLCGSPTRSVLAYIYQCTHCGFSEEKHYPHNKQTEDPMYCDRCNP
jgi:hypothetical protein